jgi:pimeloyl-ACP methyl ester carboxylesterase
MITQTANKTTTLYKEIAIEGQRIFYREAGDRTNPTILLLHGFPSSSHMFRNLIPALADQFHLIAPDYPGFGQSSMPLVNEFEYSFDHLSLVVEQFVDALKLDKYSLYVQDYGAPIGYRLATKHPERVQAIIVQNGNAYDEGLDNDFWKPLKAYWSDKSEANAAPLRDFLKLEGTRWQYTNGVRNIEAISPDAWVHDQHGMDRPGNTDIQLELFYSYRTNSPLYPQWQEYFRTYQPPTLVAWGKNDEIFPAAGAEPYKRDLENIDFNLLDTGHFALEEDGDKIAELIKNFLAKNVPEKPID